MNKPRLIDANELLKRMCNENCYHECRDNMDRCVWWHYINDSPTAYSIDEIVKQLELNKGIAFMTLANSSDEKYNFAYDEVMAYMNAAIEIVKGNYSENPNSLSEVAE